MVNATAPLIDSVIVAIHTIVNRLQFYIGGIFGLTLFYLVAKLIWEARLSKQIKGLRHEIKDLKQEILSLKQKPVKRRTKTKKAKK